MTENIMLQETEMTKTGFCIDCCTAEVELTKCSLCGEYIEDVCEECLEDDICDDCAYPEEDDDE